VVEQQEENMSIAAATTAAAATLCGRGLRSLSASPAVRRTILPAVTTTIHYRWGNSLSQLSSRASFFWSSPQSEADTVSPSSSSSSSASSSSSPDHDASSSTNDNNKRSSGSGSSSSSSSSSTSKLTTKDLVQIVSESHDLSLAESRRIIDTIFDTIVDSLAKKKTVVVAHFGTFDTITTKPRVGRNPQTGETLLIPERQRVRFKPYKSFKASVAGPTEDQA